jgi:predicted nucleic acid-binding Zn ribbon protein
MSSNPVTIGDAITLALRNFGIEKKVLHGRISAEWKNIVGEYLAEKVKIDKFEGDTIFLQTESSAIRNELSMRKTEVLEKINNSIGQKIINEIILK